MKKPKEKILYERMGNGRYKAVGVDRFILPNGPGVYLSVVDGNCTSVMHQYRTPDLAAVDGALKLFSYELAQALVEASRASPARMTAQERRAFAAYCAVMGDQATLTLNIPSAQDVVDKAMGAFRQRLLERNNLSERNG